MTVERHFRAYAQATDYNRRIEVLIGYADPDGGLPTFAEPVTLRRQETEGNYVAPTMTLHREEAQRLMDALWEVGLRPTEGSGSAGALAATERHLADMRRIAFGQLEGPARNEDCGPITPKVHTT